MDLLQKLETVEINHTSRISQEDEQFCLNEQHSYDEAWKAIDKAYKVINELWSGSTLKERYIHTNDVISKIKEAKVNCGYNFIRAITQYFSKKYNVDFDYSKLDQKFSYQQLITLDEVLDHLFAELGGFTFVEMANEQIKEKIKKSVYRFEVKKHTLHLPNFLYIEEWFESFKIFYQSKGKLEKLFDALMLFENGSPIETNALNQIKYEMGEGSKHHAIFEKYSFDIFRKIKSFKAFKNGKVSIEFHSMEFANEFANTYLSK
ncbi:hypothetical protein [Bacillus pumilus]|uniref:hypothetical protein n=1 Tax=Bacillus pumilus TaxID=1408 RepID=UPI002111A7B5|nr:hypothetical protein [Bacillus pumilus]UUD44620.1 hypothetical protein NPA43_18980 [Bacillus pumilus]